uniref:Uncharacterized protein n=1 Tax=Panagrolaimus davidi TaxID=227884 RepID=A0A914QB17_9BILA
MDGKVFAFDYITNIIKVVEDRRIFYKIFVNRFPCSFNQTYLNKNNHVKINSARLYQAPIFTVDNDDEINNNTLSGGEGEGAQDEFTWKEKGCGVSSSDTQSPVSILLIMY